MSILLTAAKLGIASNWKSCHPPLITLWYCNLWDSFIMEKIADDTAQLAQSYYNSKFAEQWFSVLEYLTLNDILKEITTSKQYYHLLGHF